MLFQARHVQITISNNEAPSHLELSTVGETDQEFAHVFKSQVP